MYVNGIPESRASLHSRSKPHFLALIVAYCTVPGALNSNGVPSDLELRPI
jgi:hypothetical protein